jgi:peptidoglycan/LPS O-acetylase OafA/YrhL
MELQHRWLCSSEKFLYIFYFLVIQYVKRNRFLFLIIIIIAIADMLLCLTVHMIHALIEYIYSKGTKNAHVY